MPNSRFSEKEDRQIKHIIASGKARGMSKEEAEHRAYGAVVNQQKRKHVGSKPRSLMFRSRRHKAS